MEKTFTELVDTLQRYWARQGCVVGQPYGMEVGAATGNPHTIIRALMHKEWNIAYIEPCRRPQDGRYGENPNRLQHYFQFQVILKPIPSNNQEIYLKSLQHIGLEIDKHDIKFVEDNWESPSLGASGLGWEVWYDGMEISQYTYLQQIGGIELEQPFLEITYGLERIAMYLQGVTHYKNIIWDKEVTYGDMFFLWEKQLSTYNLDKANTSTLKKLLELYYKEATHCLKSNLFLAAYDYVLKMSHVFNVLDARGVVTPSNRHQQFSKMREIVSKVVQEANKLKEKDN